MFLWYSYVKMVDLSTFLFVLAGLYVCQAKVVDLTSDNFDSVSKLMYWQDIKYLTRLRLPN